MIKKIIYVALAAVLAFLLTSCEKSKASNIGSGTPGVVEKIPWDRYDELYEMSRTETDPAKRCNILHEMEDMVMETGTTVPIAGIDVKLLRRDYVSDILISGIGVIDCSHVKKQGSTSINMQMITEMNHLDYGVSSAADLLEYALITQDGLVRLGEDSTPVKSMAEDIQISEDGVTYTFVLKPGLKWSDGTPLGASDFVYAWKRNADPKTASDAQDKFSYIAGFPNDLQVFASEDDRVLTVQLAVPCPYFLSMLSFGCFFPVQQEYVENAKGYKDDKGNIINPSAWAGEVGMPSSGPYIATSWKHNVSMRLEKNPMYWDADNIETETIDLMLTSDATAAYSAYMAGDLDVSCLIPTEEVDKMSESGELTCAQTFGSNNAYFNVNSDIWAGYTAEEASTVRRALSMIIDRDFVRNVAIPGHVDMMTTIVSKNMTDGNGGKFGETEGYTYPEGTGYYPEKPDFDRAREMLKSVGFEFDQEGKMTTPFSIEYLVNSGQATEAVAACLQQDFAEMGISLYIKVEDWSVFINDRKTGNYEMCRGGWLPDYNDPIGMLEIYTSNSGNNYSGLGK